MNFGRVPGEKGVWAVPYITNMAMRVVGKDGQLLPEIQQAQAGGLGQGLDESSVLILGDAEYGNEPRFKDEPARHKLLDLIGDLYLAGIPMTHLNVSAE